MNDGTVKKKVAVIGGGIAGITAALALDSRYSVVLLEKEDRLGGHTNTIEVEENGKKVGVDTGFIVLNDRTYPTLHRVLKKLNVAVRFADMSFSVECEQSGLVYGSKSLGSIYGRLSNLAKLDYYRLLLDFPQFWKQAEKWLIENSEDHMTVSEFVRQYNYSDSFYRNFLLPMGGAIWSSPDQDIAEFPIRFFLRFFKNHGMLSYKDQPRWQTVEGGSYTYLKSFKDFFSGEIRTNSQIDKIYRSDNGAHISYVSGDSEKYDHVIIATHADQALSLLADPDELESELLSQWKYQPNLAVLHTDQSFLPSAKLARASWNYRRGKQDSGDKPVSITYDMSRLQGLTSKENYCVTLNPHRDISNSKIIKEILYRHPQYTINSEKAQSALHQLRNRRNTSYAGSYFGFGFHEDACLSGYLAARELGGEI